MYIYFFSLDTCGERARAGSKRRVFALGVIEARASAQFFLVTQGGGRPFWVFDYSGLFPAFSQHVSTMCRQAVPSTKMACVLSRPCLHLATAARTFRVDHIYLFFSKYILCERGVTSSSADASRLVNALSSLVRWKSVGALRPFMLRRACGVRGLTTKGMHYRKCPRASIGCRSTDVFRLTNLLSPFLQQAHTERTPIASPPSEMGQKTLRIYFSEYYFQQEGQLVVVD